jgi:subfamily B ATP-binding cassette protein MsbA
MAFRFKMPEIPPDGSIALIRRLLVETGRQYAWRYAVALVFMTMFAGSAAVSAWLMGDVVNKIFVDQNQSMLFVLSGAVLAVSFLRGFGAYGSAITLSRIGNSIVAGIQRQIFDHLLAMGVDFYNKTHSSELITRISHNANAARAVLNTVVTSFGRDLLSVVGLGAVMVIQSPAMSLVAVLIGPAAVWGVTGLVKRIRGLARGEFRSMAKVISSMQETAQGIRIVKALNLEPVMRERMVDAIESVRKRADKIAAIQARTSPLMETLGGMAIAGVMLWAGYATIFLDQKPGAFMSFITAILLAYEPAKRLARTHVEIEANLIGVRMMYELLDTEPTMQMNSGGARLAVNSGSVRFEKVDFSYRPSEPLFKDFDFAADGGRMTALVGASGSGKSTMIALILRFYDPSSGCITVDGQDIAKVDVASLHDQIAFVSQEVVLFDDTIRQNIRFGRPDATDAEVEQAARDAMAHDFIAAMPEGYDTVIGEQGSNLSGGQRQRIAIARAMLRDARIILLDEATSSLDSESEHQVQLAFDRLMRGRTTVVIAHRLSTVLGADKIAVLSGGRIVEEGRHDTLLTLGKHYARLYHLQFENHDERARKRAAAASVAMPAR